MLEERVRILEARLDDLEAQVVRLTDLVLPTRPITDKDIEWAKTCLDKNVIK